MLAPTMGCCMRLPQDIIIPAVKKFEQVSGTTEQIGDELWAYIPQCLLPHLKWLPSEAYTHVPYVDLKTKGY